VAEGLLEETWVAAVSEATHATESYVIPADVAWDWFKQTQPRMQLGRVLMDRIHEWSEELMRERAQNAEEHTSWAELADLFEHPMWQGTGYDNGDGTVREQQFGGEPWVQICFAAMDLQKKLQGKLVPLLGSIDSFYDLEHNSATIGEKLSTMQVTRSDLDRRAEMRGATDFLPVVSPPVANVIRAAEAELSHYEEGFVPFIRGQDIQLFETYLTE